jgi:cytidylate kinase
MIPTNHIAEAFLKASELRHGPGSGAQLPAGQAFTVALSREVGARGASVARELGRRLKWPVYDHEILEQVAQDMRVGVAQVEKADERPGSWLEESIEAFASARAVSEPAYFRHLLRTLLSLGIRGECIIVGRGAAQLLSATSTLRVRLLANLEDRIAFVSRENGLSREEAARHVEKTDRERIRFIKDHFQQDPTDPQNYDLVLNSSRFSVAECADVIVEALKRLQARRVSS